MSTASSPSADQTPPTTTPSLRKVEFHLARKPQSFSLNINPNFKLETLNPNPYPNVKSSINSTLVACSQSSNHRRNDHSDFFEDAVLAFRMPLRRIGAGLENLGNTCFLNSVIQCLTYTEPLVGYLQSGKHETTCRVAGFCALCAIQKHVSRALQASGRSLAPKDLVSHLRSISRNFRNARQEDAHEFMIHLLESMHKCCLPSGVQAESPGAYEKSLVHRIFGGRLRSQVKCLQCSHCSNTFDPFLDLSLEIVKADSLYKALSHFTAPEQLDGGERQYKCEKCKLKVRALKQLTVSRAPYVLTIHLKRFRSHFSGQKIDKKVQFGSTLDLKPFVTGDYEGDLTYTLYGVLVHAGHSTHSGHYYCFVRTSNGLWYSLDDNRVIQVSERAVMEQKAYMLFYVRDRKKFVSKKAMDMTAQKENLIATMRNASTCSISGVNHAAAEKNSKEAIQSSLSVKHLVNSKPSEIVVLPNPSNSLKQVLDDTSRNITSKPPIVENKSLPIPKPNLDERKESTKCVENITVQSSDVATIHTTDPGSINKPKSDPGLLDSKSSVECSLTVISGLGDKASDKVKNDNPVPAAVLDSSIQGNVESKNVKKPKARKSRIKGQLVGKSLSKVDVLQRGIRKKISKSRALGMGHLSTKMMLDSTALSSRKGKKSKRAKQRKLILDDNLLNKEVVSANTAPSIAVATTAIHMDSGKTVIASCSKEGKKDVSKDVATYSKCNALPEKSEEILEGRAESGQAVLANGKLSNENTSREVPSKDSNGSFAEKQNHKPQTGLFAETTVVRWGGLDFPSENGEDDSPEVVTIGHTLDEWDEEYDRGKRKKVRELKNEFGGPNLFQQISSKKAKLNSKKGKRRSINEPFRI